MPAFKPLSIEQQNAIGLLILGKSDKEVAEAVGVNRTTIWEWRTAHPIFMAPLNDDGPRSGDSPGTTQVTPFIIPMKQTTATGMGEERGAMPTWLLQITNYLEEH